MLTPNPIVSAGFVGNDLIINGSAPEISVKINESGGLITVQGLTQQFLGTDGNYNLVTTDVNNSGMDTATFTPPPAFRDLKVQLSGSDSFLQIGDVNDPLTVGRDLIVSMPANTTAANLLKAGIATTSYLNLDVDSVTVPRNMTITIGQNTNYEAAVIDITNDTIGSTLETGTLTLRSYGAEPNLIGISSTTVVGNASVTTSNGNDFVSIIGVDVTGRLTISVGDGNNTVLVDNDFTEVVDSSLADVRHQQPDLRRRLGRRRVDLRVRGPACQRLEYRVGADRHQRYGPKRQYLFGGHGQRPGRR